MISIFNTNTSPGSLLEFFIINRSTVAVAKDSPITLNLLMFVMVISASSVMVSVLNTTNLLLSVYTNKREVTDEYSISLATVSNV